MRKPSSSPKKIGVSMTLSSLSIKIIDNERGHESRSSYIDRMILESAGVGA